MNTLKTLLKSFYKSLSKIHLIDKCLILIMFLLLVQSAYSLFSNVEPSFEISTIDIIVRTTTASIFGYFLSSNFIRQPGGESAEQDDYNEKELKVSEIETVSQKETAENKGTMTENQLQIIITTSIAVFCLLTLIFVRDTSGFAETDLTPSSLAIISQFRDLVSGCIGFLIGVPTTRK